MRGGTIDAMVRVSDSVDSAASPAGSSESPRRRVLRYVPVLMPPVLVLAALLVVPYEPLSQTGDVQPGEGMQAVTVEGFEETGVHIVKYEHGDTVTYSFTVRNTGPVGITVTGVPLPEEAERRLLQPVAVGLPADGSPGGSQMVRFAPFALGAGEQQRIIIEGRFDNCEYYTERALEIADSQRIEFRVAGVPRSAVVPFERDLVVRSPVIKNCDERTLDRSEHRRTEP